MISKENYIGFRTDLEDYFRWMTGVPETKKAFTPFIFRNGKNMYAERYWRHLFDFVPNEDTIIMQVWPGHFSCDCFIFTLEDLRTYCKLNKIKL
ncbi:MAG: hypothetical protein WC827_03565 [Candidatus Paceibacterota bacterium]|jgi:hypothetical protein